MPGGGFTGPIPRRLWRVSVFVRTLHPQVMGRRFSWQLNSSVKITEAGYEAFDKAGNDPSIRIVQQIAGEIGKVEVGLVAGRDDVAEADAVFDRPHQERPEPLPEFDQGDWPA